MPANMLHLSLWRLFLYGTTLGLIGLSSRVVVLGRGFRPLMIWWFKRRIGHRLIVTPTHCARIPGGAGQRRLNLGANG